MANHTNITEKTCVLANGTIKAISHKACNSFSLVSAVVWYMNNIAPGMRGYKKNIYFSMSKCGYSLDVTRQGASNECLQCFLGKTRKGEKSCLSGTVEL